MSRKPAMVLAFNRLPGRFVLRDDDIFVVSYPRSGTTWVQMILHQLSTDGAMGFQHISDRMPFIDLVSTDFSKVERLPSPRILKSHLPVGALKDDRGKYIYISRDGKDVLVSTFLFRQSFLGATESFPEFFEQFINGRLKNGSWFEHVAGWRAHAGDQNVLHLRYEQLMASLNVCVERIASFCGLTIPENRKSEIINRCSFAFMKTYESKFAPDRPVFPSEANSPGFIRRGGSGSWREFLNVEQQTAFDAIERSYSLGET